MDQFGCLISNNWCDANRADFQKRNGRAGTDPVATPWIVCRQANRSASEAGFGIIVD